MSSQLRSGLPRAISACIASARTVQTLMPTSASVLASDEVMASYIRALGAGERLVSWRRGASLPEVSPDLILAHSFMGGATLCPPLMPPNRLRQRLHRIPAAQTPEEVAVNLGRIATKLGCPQAATLPVQRLREDMAALRAADSLNAPRILLLTEVGRGQYRVIKADNPFRTFLGTLGWLKMADAGLDGVRVSPETLPQIPHDAVVILEAWTDGGTPAFLRHWPLYTSHAAVAGHWCREPVFNLMCLGPAFPEFIHRMAGCCGYQLEY